MPDSKLLPCPMCGGEPELLRGPPGCHFIRCTVCRMGGDDGSVDRVSAAWNRRAPTYLAVAVEAARREEIERCAKIVDEEGADAKEGLVKWRAQAVLDDRTLAFHEGVADACTVTAAEIRALQPAPTDALTTRLAEAEARGAARERAACAVQCERSAAEFRELIASWTGPVGNGLEGAARAMESQAAAIRSGGAA